MLFAYLAIASNLVFIPGLFDGHDLPKKVFVLALGLAALIRVIHLPKTKSPFIYCVMMAYLTFSIFNLFFVVNYSLFLERLSLDIAFIALYMALSTTKFEEKDIGLFHALLVLVAVAACLSQSYWPEEKGVMGNYGFTAGLAALGALSALSLSSSFWFAILEIVVAAFLILSVFQSRAALGVLILVMILRMIIFETKRNLSHIIALGTLIILFFSPLIISQFDRPFNRPLNRALQWRNVLAMIADNPLGIGAGQFQIQYPKYANARARDPEMLEIIETVVPPNISYRGQHEAAHNDLLEIMAERGVVGFVLFGLLLFLILSSPKSLTGAQLGLYIELLFLLGWGIFWFPLAHPTFGATFSTIAGLLRSVNEDRARALS